MKATRILVVAASLLASTFLSIDSPAQSKAPPPSGKWIVIDASTGKPISSAWVTIEWLQGHSGAVHPFDTCARLDVLLSGADGTFVIPPPPRNGRSAPVPAKPGYKQFAAQNYERKEVYLESVSGTRKERWVNAATEVGRHKMHCNDVDSVRKLLPIRKAFMELAVELLDRNESNRRIWESNARASISEDEAQLAGK